MTHTSAHMKKRKGSEKSMKQLPPEYYQLLEQLQAVDFVLVELTLYLDTHHYDQDAINQFNHYVKEREKFKKYMKIILALYYNLEIAHLVPHGIGMLLLGLGKYKKYVSK